MSYMEYEAKIQPLCPVAVKMDQARVHAPTHDTWGVVTCDECGDKLFIGPNRIYGSRIDGQECAKRLEVLLAEDHKDGRAHADSYEIPD